MKLCDFASCEYNDTASLVILRLLPSRLPA